MRTRVGAAVASAVMVGASACSGGGLLGDTGSDGMPHLLVGSDYNSVTMIETDTDGDGAISGTLDTTQQNEDYDPQFPNSGKEPVLSDHGGVTGTLTDGGRVTLTVDFPNGDLSLKGTLKGSTLTLRTPQGDGTITDYEFKRGSVQDYNEMVANLRDAMIQPL